MNKNLQIKLLKEKLEKISGRKVSLEETVIGEENYSIVPYTNKDVIKLMSMIEQNAEVKNLIRSIVDPTLPEDEEYK